MYSSMCGVPHVFCRCGIRYFRKWTTRYSFPVEHRRNISVKKSVRHVNITLYGGKDARTRGRRVASFVKPCPVNNKTSSRRKTQAATPFFYSHYRQRILKVIIWYNSDESFEADGGGCGTCGSNMAGGLFIYTYIIILCYAYLPTVYIFLSVTTLVEKGSPLWQRETRVINPSFVYTYIYIEIE